MAAAAWGVALLAGCVKDTGFGSQPIDIVGRSAPEFKVAPSRPPVSRDQVATVVGDAFDRVVATYVSEIAPATLAAATLTGLKTIDPAFRVDRASDQISLAYGDHFVAQGSFSAVKTDRTAADTFQDILDGAFRVSSAVRTASRDAQERALLDAMMGALDGHSYYMDRQELDALRIGRFIEKPDTSKGFGVSWRFDGEAIVFTAVEPGSFAAVRSLKPGLRLLEIEGMPVAAILPEERQQALDRLVEQQHVKVRFAPNTLLSPKRELSYYIFNARQTPETRLDDGIAVISAPILRDSMSGTIARFLLLAFGATEKAPVGIVLDLRENTGGIVDHTVAVISQFVDGGPVFSIAKRSDSNRFQASPKTGERPPQSSYDVPMVVIVNKDTASGAEIIARVLMERRRTVVVGTSTTGLGLIQAIVPLSSGGALRLTTGKVVTEGGHTLQGHPIVPLFCTADQARDAETVIRIGLARAGKPPQSATECAGGNWLSGIDMAVAKRIASNPELFRRALHAQQQN